MRRSVKTGGGMVLKLPRVIHFSWARNVPPEMRFFVLVFHFLVPKGSTTGWGLCPQTPAGGDTPPDPPVFFCVKKEQP